MLHPTFRAPRIGFALVLLPVCLGSASGAWPSGLAAPVEQPTRGPSASAPLPIDSPALVTATIPCVSGTCEVKVPASPIRAPIKPLPTRTNASLQGSAQR
jgi:hypothetical protein